MAAASVGLSMAFVSISKLLLLLCGLVVLLFFGLPRDTSRRLVQLSTPYAVLTAIAAFAASLLWTDAPPADALGSLAKYGKLITILMMLVLIQNRREAKFALTSFFVAQIFLLASSWMLYFHLPVPWATSNMAITHFAVFSSYLDQGIMSAVLAALCWHLRPLAPGRYGRPIAIAIAAIAMVNVFFVLAGRSGHVAGIGLLSLAVMWEMPRRLRLVALAVPFALVAILFLSSTKVRERLMLVQTEVGSYSTETKPTSSSGVRLGFWYEALKIIEQHPVLGAGVGAWSTEYNRLRRLEDPNHIDIPPNGNPHQEYLLWGIQLGVPGILLFLALLVGSLRDSLAMETCHARAVQSVLLALALVCAFNASIYDALIGDFFCVVIGLLLASGVAHSANGQSTIACTTDAA